MHAVVVTPHLELLQSHGPELLVLPERLDALGEQRGADLRRRRLLRRWRPRPSHGVLCEAWNRLRTSVCRCRGCGGCPAGRRTGGACGRFVRRTPNHATCRQAPRGGGGRRHSGGRGSGGAVAVASRGGFRLVWLALQHHDAVAVWGWQEVEGLLY